MSDSQPFQVQVLLPASSRAEARALKLDHIHVARQVIFVECGKGQKDRYIPVLPLTEAQKLARD